jgi:type 1 glutamine amidotransferase/HEAT repeat protein
MIMKTKTILTILLACSFLAAPFAIAEEPTPEQIEAVRAALPAKATVAPAQPRRVLVFNRCQGFVHGSIPLAAKAMAMLGEATGAYEAVLSEDPAMFAPESLAGFDAIIMNNTTGNPLEDPAHKESLLAFVRGGKGLVGIHAATDCFYDWPEYGELIGGYFDGHPWNADVTVGIKIDDPGHPVNAAFNGTGFRITDEIYQFREPYSREKLRVLLSLDPANTDMTLEGIKRTDGDFAVSWVRSYGEGRMFYCSLGHNLEVFMTPAVLQHYLDGIQFALGDLPADTTPSAALPPEHAAQAKMDGLHAALASIAEGTRSWKQGEDGRPFEDLRALAVGSIGDPETAPVVEDALAGMLQAAETDDARHHVSKILNLCATERSVRALAPMLIVPATAEQARYVLAAIPGPVAGRALRDALSTTDGPVLAGLIESLGDRRDEAAAGTLAALMRAQDATVAAAATRALGRIGGETALAALMRAKMRDGGQNVDDALLRCASGMTGNPEGAARVFEALYQPEEAAATRAGALAGLASLHGPGALPFAIEALQADVPVLANAAGAILRSMPGEEVSATLASLIPGLDPASQISTLGILADRGGSHALAAAMECVASDDKTLRAAALGALGIVGDAGSVPVLARAAASPERDEARVAADSLARVSGPGVAEAIADLAATAEPGVRVAAINAITARSMAGQDTLLASLLAHDDPSVRAAAGKALGAVGVDDSLAHVIEWIVRETDPAAMEAGEGAAVDLVRRQEKGAPRAALALAALDAGPKPESAAALVRVLGASGEDAALSSLRKATSSGDPLVQESAIRVLAEWPTSEPSEVLYKLAGNAPTKALQIVALRGHLRMLGMPGPNDAAKTVRLIERALKRAEGPDEIRMAIGILADTPHPDAEGVVRRYEGDEALKADVEAALAKIANRSFRVWASHNEGAVDAAVDGDPATRWATGVTQQPGQWFAVDFGEERQIRSIVLDSAGSAQDYPAGYAVYVSNSSEHWGPPVAEGKGDSAVIEIPVDKARGRFVRIQQTGEKNGLWWSIHELVINTD